MTASDFMSGLLDICFFLFDKHDSVIMLVVFAVLMFCFAFSLIGRLGRF